MKHDIKAGLIQLGVTHPELRPSIRPLLKQADLGEDGDWFGACTVQVARLTKQFAEYERYYATHNSAPPGDFERASKLFSEVKRLLK